MNFKLLLKDPTLEILSILEYKDLTVRELRRELKTVSKATLYRHINKMHEDNFIKISKTKIVNGLKQNTYTINRDNVITPKDFEKISNQERQNIYMKNFIGFIKSLIKIFRKNTYSNNFNVIFIKFRVNVTKKESNEMYKRINELIKEYSDLPLTEDREIRELSLVIQGLDRE